MSYKRKEVIGDCTLYLGDCLEVMPTLGKVDAVVTSPPYDSLREYGAGFDGVDLMLCLELVSVNLAEGGVCMWNVSDATVDGSETGSSFKQALHAIECGLRLHDTMIYIKEHVSNPDGVRYLSAHEYMFIFSKGAPKTFNPIKDRANKKAGIIISGTTRAADGSLRHKHGNGKEIKDFGARYNYWHIVKCSGNLGHPAPMPYSMARDHISSWTNSGDNVLDPFMGSGTTLVACAKMGRKGIGIELDPNYFEIACKRVEEAYSQPDMFVEQPKPKPKPKPVQVGMFDADEK